MISSFATTQSKTRHVIEGISKIGYIQLEDGSWEMAPFASSLRSVLQYMGEKITYDDVLALSGGAFRSVWNTAEWDGGNSDVAHTTGDRLDPFNHTFLAVGYEARFYGRKENQGTNHFGCFDEYLDFEGMRSAIIESIDQNLPVIALGVIGPPECCVIAGYDENGEVLIGWNFWQNDPNFDKNGEKEDSGYFRKRGWYQNTEGLVLIHSKQKSISTQDLDRKTLDWALAVSKQEIAGTYMLGQAAYSAWAADMNKEENFPVDNDEILGWRMTVVDDAGMIIDSRLQAARYLRQIAQRRSEIAPNLLAAADLYDEEHKLAGKIWDAMGKVEPRYRSLANSCVRQEIVKAILAAKDLDANAVKFLEAALV